MSNFKFKINNVGSINHADMEIGRINVIGGKNCTGKSTTSNLLYCFLRAISSENDSTINELLDSEFDITGPQDYNDNAGIYSIDFSCTFDFKNFEFSKKGDLDITKVFYFDSFSLFDNKSGGTYFLEHVKSLEAALEITEDKNNKDWEVEKLIKEILGGEIKKENGELFFVRENGFKTHMKNTSSGVKQVAIIQTLLNNNELEPNSFLIMDEPEVNLHPEWQIKFAKILVLLVKELDLSIYIASHSPFFIEAIELYSQYYGLLDESFFYLTQKAEGYQYDIVSVDSNNLEAIYRNLGQPYDILDKIKMDLMFKKLDGD
ncbi:MAG: AAA family ATPase [Methanobrevibacter ruminantium]|uniref:AAA family ATPase n=1 Tax=Methanobrevibacter ruminantium TaxID=83816 RepID=UPI0026ED71D8|nr:AAA family ATPase [Methanobrevibacter ruminantium]MCI5737964.1 ATP-binding protein [Methanobrevibacter ruminantium]MDO5841654.1 AAA family ATPase [Methanobrevibacter ruminantium]